MPKHWRSSASTDNALLFIAERIGALALSGDLAGVERLRAIAHHLDQLAPPNGDLH